MEQNGTGVGQEAPAELKQNLTVSPVKKPMSQDSSQPYIDKQETTNHWKTSDKTQNGHRESEGTETQSRTVQKAESKTPNGVSTSTVKETSSQVTSKTVEASQCSLPELGTLAPSLLSQNGLFSQAAGCNGEQKSPKTITNSAQCQKKLVDHPVPEGICPIPEVQSDGQMKQGTGLQTKPFIDRQEIFNRCKTSEETQNGRIEMEAQEKKSNAIQYSVSQGPNATTSQTVKEKPQQSSFSSNEPSEKRPLEAAAPTSSSPTNPVSNQNGSTPGNQDGSAKTFLQSISNYLFSWNDGSSNNTSSPTVQGSGTPRQQEGCPPSVPTTPQAPVSSSSCMNVQEQPSQSAVSETSKESREVSGSHDRTMLKEIPNVPSGLKTTEDNVKQSLPQATTEMTQVNNIRSVQAPLRPAFSLDANVKVNGDNQQQIAFTKNNLPIHHAPARLSSVDSTEPKVDFKTGLSFFQTDMIGDQASPAPTEAQGKSTTPEKAETGSQVSQSSNQPALKMNAPACFTSKPWAPVKPPVPVAKNKVQTTPPQKDYSVAASETGKPQVAPYPATSSTYSSTSDVSLSSNPSLASASGIRGILTPRRSSQTVSDVTDRRQSQPSMTSSRDTSLLGHGPVSASPFPGRRAESKLGGMQRANSLPSQDVGQHASSGIKGRDMNKAQMTFKAQAPPVTSASTKSETASMKSETTDRQQSLTLSNSGETLKRLTGPLPSLDSLSSKASPSPSTPKAVTATPYVDQQETVNKSRVSEKTKTGHRESETEETRKQSVQQSHSRTPTMSSSTRIEEESTHTVSQSNEVIYGTAQPQDQISPQRPTAWPNGTCRQSDLTSKIDPPFSSVPGQTPQVSSKQSPEQQTKSIEEQIIKTSNETLTRQDVNAPSSVTKPSSSNDPVVAPQRRAPQTPTAGTPCADKQETYSHSKISEKTDTGHRESETAEKKCYGHEQSVSRTPTTITSTTVDEQSFQTLSETKETSGYVTKPKSGSTSCGFPADSEKVISVPHSATPRPVGTNHLEQKLTQSKTILSRESSEHQAANLSSKLGDLKPSLLHQQLKQQQQPQQQQQQQKTQEEVNTTNMITTSTGIHSKHDSGYQRTAVAPQLQSDSQPFVDKQETFNKSRVSEKTEMGTRETDIAEKNSSSFQQSFSRSPSRSSSTTTEEKRYQSVSQTHETSRDQGLREKEKQSITSPGSHLVTYQTTIPASSTPSAQKRSSATMQRTQSIDKHARTSREHIIPIQLTTDQTSSTNSHVQSVKESRTQHQRTTAQQREHIIPVQLSPFPERRAFLQEASADRRYSVSAGWPGVEWGHPALPSSWQTPRWGQQGHTDWSLPDPAPPAAASAAAAAAAAWPESNRQQPVFCCPVVSGQQAAALAPLYSTPRL